MLPSLFKLLTRPRYAGLPSLRLRRKEGLGSCLKKSLLFTQQRGARGESLCKVLTRSRYAGLPSLRLRRKVGLGLLFKNPPSLLRKEGQGVSRQAYILKADYLNTPQINSAKLLTSTKSSVIFCVLTCESVQINFLINPQFFNLFKPSFTNRPCVVIT
ncbi:hypothetical protein CLV57_3063 [Mucilaginibacter auburnensis]|uniref:Uncharacterized protein n=1 Tax=Mucilaginibacter auburnensis TaxID=1457233 RepID=A0A2H9VNL1_9SPHI|nr:hypothetical protein CLV57_3063 [Mucilaginibacter auburnensis]